MKAVDLTAENWDIYLQHIVIYFYIVKEILFEHQAAAPSLKISSQILCIIVIYRHNYHVFCVFVFLIFSDPQHLCPV